MATGRWSAVTCHVALSLLATASLWAVVSAAAPESKLHLRPQGAGGHRLSGAAAPLHAPMSNLARSDVFSQRARLSLGLQDPARPRPQSPLPWQQPPEWAPPYAPFLNDLPDLIRSQRREGVHWLAVFALTHLHHGSAEAFILLNTLTSYLLLGGGESYIVVVATKEALHGCLHLRLPCYNATGQVDSRYLSGYTLGTWAKVLMTRLVLRALPPDLNLHVSDHDVVYLKNIYTSIDLFAARFAGADVMAQFEDKPRRGINTGVIFARNTPRIRMMYDEWIRGIDPHLHDQKVFHKLMGNLTAVLGRTVAANTSVALLLRHNAPWVNRKRWCHYCRSADYGDCWHGDDVRHCKVPYRLYIHAICVADKVRYIQGLGLWFLDGNAPFATNYTAIAAAGLPCAPPHDVAKLQAVL